MSKDMYDFDPLAPAQAAFKSLARDTNIQPVAGGASFAIGGQDMPFAWLSYASALANQARYGLPDVGTFLNRAKAEYLAKRPSTEDGKVFHPSREAAVVAGLTPATLVGGLAHEVGHYICDHAGKMVAEKDLARFDGLVKLLYKLGGSQAFQGLHRHANLMADIRLERRLGARYGGLKARFTSLQEWVNKLEEEARAKGEMASLLMMSLRDIGKGWLTQAEWEKLYPKQARDFVLANKPIWEGLTQVTSSDEASGHEPVEAALRWAIALLEDGQEPEEPEEGGDGGGDGDEDGPDGGGKEGKGKEGKGKGKDGEGEDGEGEDVGGGHGLPSGDISNILKGQYKAHDPSSAVKEAFEKGSKEIDHKVWVDGAKVTTRIDPKQVFGS